MARNKSKPHTLARCTPTAKREPHLLRSPWGAILGNAACDDGISGHAFDVQVNGFGSERPGKKKAIDNCAHRTARPEAIQLEQPFWYASQPIGVRNGVHTFPAPKSLTATPATGGSRCSKRGCQKPRGGTSGHNPQQRCPHLPGGMATTELLGELITGDTTALADSRNFLPFLKAAPGMLRRLWSPLTSTVTSRRPLLLA